jgi:hypothetical protein
MTGSAAASSKVGKLGSEDQGPGSTIHVISNSYCKPPYIDEECMMRNVCWSFLQLSAEYTVTCV